MKGRTDWLSIGISVALLLTLVVFTVLLPAETTAALDAARIGVCEVLGAWFLLLVIGCIGFVAYMAASKYGQVRMGRDKPEYKTFAWITMIFCAAMGTSILYWSAIEWVYYVQQPPFGYAPLSNEAVEIALPYSLFHWGVPAWSVYAVGAVPLAYRCYVRKKDGMSLPAACEGVIGEKRANGWLGRVLNIIFVLGILGGLCITYGTGIPMLAGNLDALFQTGTGFGVCAILIAVVTAVFGTTTCLGLQKGMSKLSTVATYAAILLCLLFFVLGSPLFTVKNSVQSLGLMIRNLIPMLTNLDAVTGGTFTRDWTVFYWAWWVCLAPWMWIFVAKISRGRSIRAIVSAVAVAGAAGSALFFCTISNYGIQAYLDGAFDAVAKMKELGAGLLVTETVLSLPLGKAVLVLWFLTGFCMMTNMLGSASYSLSAAATRDLRAGEDPSRRMRVFWAAMLCVAPLCLLYAGSVTGSVSLGGMQALLILSAVPVSVTVVLAMASAVKWLREDFGSLSRAEIARAFAPEETRAD